MRIKDADEALGQIKTRYEPDMASPKRHSVLNGKEMNEGLTPFTRGHHNLVNVLIPSELKCASLITLKLVELTRYE